MIGFINDPKRLLPVSEDFHSKAKIFDECSFATHNGCALSDYDSPAHGSAHKNANKNNTMPLCSIMNFKLMPMRCCASIMLQTYVESHAGYEDSKNRLDLTQMTKKHMN